MQSELDSLIDPAGWLEWNGDFALDTLYYGEYKNTGAGAGTSGRVKWKGYRVITSAAEASAFTVGSFIDGDVWLAGTSIPFDTGL
jgi:pectinesterase